MAHFTLDTSGAVVLTEALHVGGLHYWPGPVTLDQLSPFAQGYVKAALTEKFLYTRSGVPVTPRFVMLARATLAAMLKDCEALSSEITACVTGGDLARGRVAWGWRQRAEGDPRSPLRALHERFPPITLSIGEDGLIYAEARS